MTIRDPEVARMFRSLRDGLFRLNGAAIGTVFPSLLLAGLATLHFERDGLYLIFVLGGIFSTIGVLWQSREIRRLSAKIEAALSEPLDTSAP
jgi:hypothetical protein